MALITGALSSHLFTSIPPLWLLYLLTIGAIALLLSPTQRYLALAVLACCWSLWNFHFRLLDRLDPSFSGQIVELEGVISSPPEAGDDYIRFRFAPAFDKTRAGLPASLLVYWYKKWPALSAGQQWRLQLKLKPPWASTNFQGADKERWYFAKGIGGLASVRSGELLRQGPGPGQLIHAVRERVMQQISSQVNNEQQRGIIKALATADRSGMSEQDRRLLNLTGTSHLLAISGLHIGLAAAGGMWLSRLAGWFLPMLRIGGVSIMLSIACGLLTAISYAALAGFGVPTIRAVAMLACVLLALALSRSIHPLRAWLLAMAAVLLTDPFAPLGAGFWFSFLAVAALMFQFAPRTGHLSWWKTLLLAQSAIMLVLLPVSAAWFNSFSPVGFLANLVAIPWVSFLVVPFVLAGVAALAISTSLAAIAWSIAGAASSGLLYFLEFLARVQGPLAYLPTPSMLQMGLALAGGFLLLLPRGITGRWCAAFLFAPLFLPPAERTEQGTVLLEVLDAGQGTAVVLSTPGHTLLYDSGPGDGHGHDTVGATIAPALDRLGGTAPERVIISHADLDHAGGLRTVLDRYPGALYLANHPDQAGCRVPMQWQWEGVEFATLHPTPALPYRGNDNSCVISVRSEGISVLLSGDISKAVENRLLLEGMLPHSVVLVPHHGSRTSSSKAFIDRLQPEIAIATASLGNRFDFPREEIRQRYLDAGASFWSTGECGALRLRLDSMRGIQAESARRLRKAVWRWPASSNCP